MLMSGNINFGAINYIVISWKTRSNNGLQGFPENLRFVGTPYFKDFPRINIFIEQEKNIQR